MDLPYILDAHVDTMLKVCDEGADLGEGIPQGHVDLDRLEEAGIRIVFFALWPSPEDHPGRSFERVCSLAEAFHAQLQKHRDRMELAGSMAEARNIVSRGRLAALLGVEGGHAIEGDLGKLRELARMGARYMTLTWNNHLSWAESCQAREEGAPRGLTPFGKKVLKEMHRLGMAADCAHSSSRTLRDVLCMDVPPPVCSHAGARSVHEHCRNLSDQDIEALAGKGGAMGMVLFPGFLAGSGRADLESALRHAERILAVGGRETLGIGSDFDGIDEVATGLEDCSKLPRLLEGIRDRAGLDARELRGVAHGNLMRVFEAWE